MALMAPPSVSPRQPSARYEVSQSRLTSKGSAPMSAGRSASMTATTASGKANAVDSPIPRMPVSVVIRQKTDECAAKVSTCSILGRARTSGLRLRVDVVGCEALRRRQDELHDRVALRGEE